MSKQLFIFLIIILAVILVVWQLFLPAFNTVSLAREDLKSWEEKVGETESLNQKLIELKKKYEALEAQVKKIEAALPKGQDIPALMIQLEALTSQNGLILNSVDFISPVEAKKKKAAETETGQESTASAVPAGVKSIDMELNLSGNYNSLKNFLKAVESNLRIMDISAINFGSAGSGETNTISGLTGLLITLTAYYR